MRYSKLFGKTVRHAPGDATTVSHKLLYQAGYIRESAAGRYFFLPLGMRVQQKIMDIVRREMDNSGAQEMISPVLHPLELWKETNRTNTTGFELMKVTDRRGAEFALGGTAEEMFVDVVRRFQLSYKDLPFNIYQFSSKFRDEMRARGGLLRVREFIMKDAYSFDADENEFKKEYENMRETYSRIFKLMGLDTVVVESDNGYIGGEYCHEFVVESDIGETSYLTTEEKEYAAHIDVATFERTPVNPDDEIKPMEIVKQPQWVKTMEDNEKHYKLPPHRFLKNVVYKNRVNKEIVIATIRGDLEVNKTKLEHILNAVGQLDDAGEEDLHAIGTKRGYVHSWGHKGVRTVGDLSLETVRNFVGGQKEDDTDSINVNYGRDFICEKLADIALAAEGHTHEGKRLILKKGIEVGNIFQLGHHYTRLMKDAFFTDKDGKKKPYYMGCYGIGIGRTMATVVEKYHDEKGILWPSEIAPFRVQLLVLGNDPEVSKNAERFYDELKKNNIDVLFDDRDISPGEKFADFDLIGIPVRLVISKKTGDKVEFKERAGKDITVLSHEEAIKKILS